MTAVDSTSYDQFFDVFEEFNFPKSESSANLSTPRSPKPSVHASDAQLPGIMGDFFRAVEQASFPLMPSSDSLVSLSSHNSLGNTSTLTSQEHLDESFFQVVQNLIVTNSHSQAHLSELAEKDATNNPSQPLLPAALIKFLDAFNEFMHNPRDEEI